MTTPLGEQGTYAKEGLAVGTLVDEKNLHYGDSFNEADKFLRLLFPCGIPVEKYRDVLYIVRCWDKLKRIATNPEAFKENPYRDVAGYSLLRSVQWEMENVRTCPSE